MDNNLFDDLVASIKFAQLVDYHKTFQTVAPHV